MLYLVLKRDLQKVALACKHVLSESELPDALETIQWITSSTWYRMADLRGGKVVVSPTISTYLPSVAVFEQQGLSPKEQFAIYAKGLVGVVVPWTSLGRSDLAIQYNISEEGEGFHGDKLRALPDPIPARDEIIPNLDSVPMSVLNHPVGNKHEVDFAAYDLSPTVSSPVVDGLDAV